MLSNIVDNYIFPLYNHNMQNWAWEGQNVFLKDFKVGSRLIKE